MGDKEYFIWRMHELIAELKIPLVDERVYNKLKIRSKPNLTINFIFEQNESILKGFLGLSEYFHTIVVGQNNTFYIPHDELLLFKLESI